MSSQDKSSVRKGFIRIYKARSTSNLNDTRIIRPSSILPVTETRERSNSNLSWDNFGTEFNTQIYPSAPTSAGDLTTGTSSNQASIPEIRLNNVLVNNSQLSILSSAIKFGPGPRKCLIKTCHSTIGMSIKKTAHGCYKLIHVEDHSLASEAGLQAGDYIIEFAGMGPVKDVDSHQFMKTLQEKNSASADIELVVADPFTLYRLHASKKFEKDYLPFDEDVPHECVFEGISKDQCLEFSLKSHRDKRYEIAGVSPNSAAARAGLRTGDHLISVSGNIILNWSQTEIIKLISNSKQKDCLRLVVCNFETWQSVKKAFTSSKVLSKSLANLSTRETSNIKDELSLDEIKAEFVQAGEDISKMSRLNKKLCEKIEQLELSNRTRGQCAICLELLGGRTSVTPCGHMYCTDCVQEMAFSSAKADMECPTCRKSFFLSSCYPVFF